VAQDNKSAIRAITTALLLLYIAYRFKPFVHPAPFTPYDTYILVAVAVLLILPLMRLRVIAKVPGSYTFPDAKPEQYPQLDRATFDRYAADLEGMGFERAQDFSLVGEGGATIPSFCRIYVHPREQMYAEVAQLFPPGRRVPVLCSIQTVFNDDWSLGVGNNQPQPAAVFIRNPRGVGRAMPGKTPFELLQAHKEWRQQMIQELWLTPQPASLEAYRIHQRHRAQQRAEIVVKGSFLARLGIYYKRKAAPVYDWQGDWPKEAARKLRPNAG
jgi:hypothetical protein